MGIRICPDMPKKRQTDSCSNCSRSFESFFMFLTPHAQYSHRALTALPSITIHRSHYLIAGSEENKRENMAPNVTEKTSLVNKGEDDESMKKLKAYQP